MTEPWFEEIYLGYSDCETCGVNTDTVEVSRNDDGTYDVRVSVGCYSGESDYDISAGRAIGILESWTHLDPSVRTLIERVQRDLQK